MLRVIDQCAIWSKLCFFDFSIFLVAKLRVEPELIKQQRKASLWSEDANKLWAVFVNGELLDVEIQKIATENAFEYLHLLIKPLKRDIKCEFRLPDVQVVQIGHLKTVSLGKPLQHGDG